MIFVRASRWIAHSFIKISAHPLSLERTCPIARETPQGVRDEFGLVDDCRCAKGADDCIKAFSENIFMEDLKKIDVPTLIIHGDDDQIVPIGALAASLNIVRNATLSVYLVLDTALPSHAKIS